MNSAARASASRKASSDDVPRSAAMRMFSSTLNVVWNELCVLSGWFRMWQFQPPSANCALRTRRASGGRRGSSGRGSTRESKPEAEMAEVDALEQECPVDSLSGGMNRSKRRSSGAGGWMASGNAEGDEQQQRPGRGRPAAGRPLAVASLAGEQLGDPARSRASAARSSLPRLAGSSSRSRMTCQRTAESPCEKPVDHGLVARHLGGGR